LIQYRSDRVANKSAISLAVGDSKMLQIPR
jgi:hypothetical protein